MDRIKYKPMSVNRAWQGRRFISDDYKVFKWKRKRCLYIAHDAQKETQK